VNKQGTILEKYKQVMENKFLAQWNSTPQYTKLENFEGFSEWFECKISNVDSHKFVAMVWCLLSTKK
jgi:hypothetical protein